jgi:HlyD family secretion protein
VQFLVSEKEDVLTIPNMALRFRPPEDKNEAQDLMRQEQGRAAPRVGQRRTSRGGGGDGGEGRRVRQVKIYVVKNGKAQPVDVQAGITDGSKTEVIAGALNENDGVIIGMSGSATSQAQSGVANPFQPQQPRGFGLR